MTTDYGKMTVMENLLGPEPTLLPEDPAVAELNSGASGEDVAQRFPTSSAAWAAAAAQARQDDALLPWYAYARVGYHRGLDTLRRNGWKGHGPIPWDHEPNRGFLQCLAQLSAAAQAVEEDDEAQRCAAFLADSSPEAAARLLDQ